MATTSPRGRVSVPRQPDDYSREAAEMRREFLREQAGASLEHVGSYSFDPSILPGNVEHFTGVAQVPLGIAGPMLVNGEHAQGEFYVPMATAEGTLLASYNRGMKLVRDARDFGRWLREHFAEIAAAAESTTRSGKLIEIEQYSASRMLYTRFDYTTGD